jgi:hypothetical protein
MQTADAAHDRPYGAESSECWKAVFNNRRFLEETCTLLNERKVLVRALHSMVERRKWGTTKLESWV